MSTDLGTIIIIIIHSDVTKNSSGTQTVVENDMVMGNAVIPRSVITVGNLGMGGFSL